MKKNNYIGNKDIAGVREKTLSLFPAMRTYVECFAGGAGIGKYVYSRGVNCVFVELDKKQCLELESSMPAAVVKNVCARSFLQEWQFVINPNVVVFLDPPYILSTRYNATEYYNYELSDYDHIQLLSTILQLPCKVVIVHPVCVLYDRYLSHWQWRDVSIRYHKKTSLERLYYNFLWDPVDVFDYVGQGANATDRQRIKRKVANLIKKINSLSTSEMAVFKKMYQ